MVSKDYEKLWFKGVAKKIWLIRVVKKILRMVAKKNSEKSENMLTFSQ